MSSFSSGRFAVYKNTTDKKLKKPFSLKNSVHVEPLWFSLDNLTLYAALTTYSSMVLHAIKENLRCAEAFLLRTGSSDKLEIPCGTKFLRVLIFTIFAIFPAIRKNNFPPNINENTFPAKIYSRVLNILWLKFTTQKYNTKKSCLFNYNSPLQFRNKTVYNELVLQCIVWKSVFRLHPDCTYLTRTKILSMLGTWYFLKINSQQEKPMCPSVVNAIRPFYTISKIWQTRETLNIMTKSKRSKITPSHYNT